MQTIIVKDHAGAVLARVTTRSYFDINHVDDLTQLLMDKGASIQPDNVQYAEASPTD
jgi:hypothetical protein